MSRLDLSVRPLITDSVDESRTAPDTVSYPKTKTCPTLVTWKVLASGSKGRHAEESKRVKTDTGGELSSTTRNP
jgi:hypothetical protein